MEQSLCETHFQVFAKASLYTEITFSTVQGQNLLKLFSIYTHTWLGAINSLLLLFFKPTSAYKIWNTHIIAYVDKLKSSIVRYLICRHLQLRCKHIQTDHVSFFHKLSHSPDLQPASLTSRGNVFTKRAQMMTGPLTCRCMYLWRKSLRVHKCSRVYSTIPQRCEAHKQQLLVVSTARHFLDVLHVLWKNTPLPASKVKFTALYRST